ncbi:MULTISPECIES: hypothetical protein [unclassified Pseudomonas]|uniref:hypothetical protein n=1 Tax=unclassified Pseudomonas TaxID=196821 RepID=UPI0011B06BF9|nr:MULTISPECIES: hypothetical protein [unclassified Pseudomonas]
MEWTFVLHAIGSHLPSAEAIAAFAGAGSAIAAVWTIKRTASARENERLLAYAVLTLERSFAALSGQSRPGSPPPSDRLGWLTAARLVEEYKSAKERMKDPLILQECKSHEAHWRNQFRNKLELISEGPMDYYTRAGFGKEVQQTSAIIVHNFADWPADKEDELDKYLNHADAIKKLGVSNKWFVLRHYCRLL